jgi:hypothetical protein
MPTKEIDYSKTVIYKIVCRDVDVKDAYIGSTTAFINRKSQHKSSAKLKEKIPKVDGHRECDKKLYTFIVNNGGWTNFDMIMIEQYQCKNNLEKLARERYWIEQMKPSLNSVISTVLSDDERDDQQKVYQCECGSKYKGMNKKDHNNTDKHKKHIEKAK